MNSMALKHMGKYQWSLLQLLLSHLKPSGHMSPSTFPPTALYCSLQWYIVSLGNCLYTKKSAPWLKTFSNSSTLGDKCFPPTFSLFYSVIYVIIHYIYYLRVSCCCLWLWDCQAVLSSTFL
jgi:hypothetical protein